MPTSTQAPRPWWMTITREEFVKSIGPHAEKHELNLLIGEIKSAASVIQAQIESPVRRSNRTWLASAKEARARIKERHDALHQELRQRNEATAAAAGASFRQRSKIQFMAIRDDLQADRIQLKDAVLAILTSFIDR
jgi:hypothetical protein